MPPRRCSTIPRTPAHDAQVDRLPTRSIWHEAREFTAPAGRSGIRGKQFGDAAAQGLDSGVKAQPVRRRHEDLVPPATVNVERQVEQERSGCSGAAAKDGLTEEDIHELGAVNRDVLRDEEAVHQVEQVVAIPALKQALKL